MQAAYLHSQALKLITDSQPLLQQSHSFLPTCLVLSIGRLGNGGNQGKENQREEDGKLRREKSG